MKLNEWRKAKGWTYAQLAEKVGASHSTVVRRWCVGEGVPSTEFQLAIQEATGGAVGRDEWQGDVGGAEKEKSA